MRKIFTILMLLPLTGFGQYETAYIVNGDTVCLKTGTDSLFDKAGQNYTYKARIKLKASTLIGFILGLDGLIDEKALEIAARANHTGTQPANTITGLSTVATSGSYPDLSNKPSLSTVATTGSYNDLTNKPAVHNKVTLAADVTNNNAVANTLQDVTGLSFAVVAGNTYEFEFVIFYTAAQTTTGARYTINGPATSWLVYRSDYSLTTTSRTFNESLTGYNLPAASNATSAATGGNMAVIKGTITPTANGNVIARFASEIANSAIVAKGGKSYVIYSIQ